MTTKYIKHDARPTKIGIAVLRARLSLRETQEEFSDRFRVSKTTIHKWERGYVTRMQRVYQEMLDALLKRLQAEGRLLPEAVVQTIFKDEVNEPIVRN